MRVRPWFAAVVDPVDEKPDPSNDPVSPDPDVDADVVSTGSVVQCAIMPIDFIAGRLGAYGPGSVFSMTFPVQFERTS